MGRTKKELRNEETVYCRLSFSCAQNLESFFKHFNAVKELIAFMTFRQNVGFDDIFLLSPPEEINGFQFVNHLATVHIQYENDFTEKDSFTCIGFEDIESSLPAFLMLLYNNEERKPLYSSGYRNDITHGKYRVLDEKIARTGFALMGLIYCCVLTRIGVDSQTIHKISNIPELLKS